MTPHDLAALDVKSYVAELKSRLRDDQRWADMLDPLLVERTRDVLTRMIESLDAQKARAVRDGISDSRWLHGMGDLRRYALRRLEVMPLPIGGSSSKESKAWRAFSARLAEELLVVDPLTLNKLKAPYGDMTAREWLKARNEKREVAQ